MVYFRAKYEDGSGLGRRASHSQVSSSDPDEVKLSTNGPVVFNTAITNLGHGYSTSTGKFVAPAPGVYAFYVHAIATSRGSIKLGLYTSGADSSSASGRVFSLMSDASDQASVTAFVRLVQGDEVYVQVIDDAPYIMDSFAYFTGVLVVPE